MEIRYRNEYSSGIKIGNNPRMETRIIPCVGKYREM
jgi:hypothetical protein